MTDNNETLMIAADLCSETTLEGVVRFVHNFNKLGKKIRVESLVDELNERGASIPIEYSYKADGVEGTAIPTPENGLMKLRIELNVNCTAGLDHKAALIRAVRAVNGKQPQANTNSSKRWTHSDTHIVRENMQTKSLTVAELATMLGRTQGSVRTMMSRIGRGLV